MSYELQPTRVLRSTPELLLYAKNYRDRRKADGHCINHSGVRATHGRRCDRCAVLHLGRHLLDPSHRAHLTARRLLKELAAIAAAPPFTAFPQEQP